MSKLRQALDEYVATNRALGTQLKWPAQELLHFLDFLDCEEATFITTDLAVRWATAPVGVEAATWARRLSIVRRFATWMCATDPRTQIPPPGLLPARHRRKPPHIFSDQEIRDLMIAAGGLRSASGLRAATYQTLIGLLAACGLRPGEALALDVADVDLHGGILSVRLTKFGKSRFVPVEPSTSLALRHYAHLRDRICPLRQSQAFLTSDRGERLPAPAARRTFAALTRTIGLRPAARRGHSGRTRGPRQQDLRHTFATNRLIDWYRAGLDVDRMMPGLSTYLGHGQVSFTYWYIQAVPELLQLATERLTGRAAGGAW